MEVGLHTNPVALVVESNSLIPEWLAEKVIAEIDRLERRVAELEKYQREVQRGA